MGERKTSEKVKRKLGAGITKRLELTKSHVVEYPKNGDKYGRTNKFYRLHMIPGYDLLQYSLVVRPFVMRKYGIPDVETLDILLYLFPIQYFTTDDLTHLRVFTKKIYFKDLLEQGYLELVVKAKTHMSNIYRLTDLSVDAVMDYYQYLTGDKVFDSKAQGNPFDYQDRTEIDAKREEIIERCTRNLQTRRYAFRGRIGPTAGPHDT